MVPIIFYTSWNESPSQYLNRIRHQTPRSRGRWGNIVGCINKKDAKYAVCQDGHLSIQRAIADGFRLDQIVYIKREANASIPEVNGGFAISYQGPLNIIPSIWWLSLTFDELVNLKQPKKTKLLSSIVSANKTLAGHRARLCFIERCANIFKFDVYGRGHHKDSFNKNYKGELSSNGRCKYKGLEDYKYSIAIENISESGYITEKFNDCILSWTIPLYYGAKNIGTYFPFESFREINDLKCLNEPNRILDIITEGEDIISECALQEARERILFTYNLWNIVECLINKIT